MNRLLILVCLVSLAVVPNPTCRPAPVKITPEHTTLSAGERQQFSAELRQGSAGEIHWSLLRGSGIISETGLYKAPYHVPHEIVVTVHADLEREDTGEKEHSVVDVVLHPGFSPGADSCCSAAQGRPPEPTTHVQLDVDPAVIATISPAYPEEAIKQGVEGRVVISALICRKGEIFDTWIIESIPELDEAAVAAIRQWEFQPGQVDGEAQAAWVTIPVQFALADTSTATPAR